MQTMWCRFFFSTDDLASNSLSFNVVFVVWKKNSFELKKKRDKDFNLMAEMTLILLFGKLNENV